MYVTVLLPLPLRRWFTYEVPKKWESDITLFKRVLVPFGTKKVYTGLIISIEQHAEADYVIKEILSVQDETPLIAQWQWDFWQWMSRYYLCSQGEVMKAALPAPFKMENSYQVLYNPLFDEDTSVSLNPSEQHIIDLLREKNTLTVQQLQKQTKTTVLYKLLERLQEKGALFIEERIRETYRVKKEDFVSLMSPFQTDKKALNEILDKLDKKAPKQAEMVLRFLELSAQDAGIAVKKSKLLKQVASPAALKALQKKKILKIESQAVSRLHALVEKTIPPYVLVPSQKKALEAIREQFNTFSTVLLHGVTSSGKTEIYIHLIKEQLDKGKQVLYLLPEIALTGQIVYRLSRHFGKRVGVYHSKFSESEKVEIWHKVKANTNRYNLILGVRSAIFLPFVDLGLVILDEEHENTYQQQDPAPRYHSRVAAAKLIQLHKAKLLLGTATPSLESMYASLVAKNIGYVALRKRFYDVKLPTFEVVDIAKERKKNKVEFSFSWILRDAIGKALSAGEQIILFQNRRGYAPYLRCKKCNWIARCEHCDVSMTYHKYHDKLICHYCEYQTRVPDICPECGGKVEFNAGFGTEKLQEEIQILFPDARVGRMDLDTMRKKHDHEKLIEKFENHDIDILIGTQMVAKGLDFRNVGLVGIPDIDALINFPDFRAFERTFQLITQVSGRAGRSQKQGLVVLQTTMPDHPLIQQIISYDNRQFYESQLQERNQFLYPPFVVLLKIVLKHKDASVLRHAATVLKQGLDKMFTEKRVLGPVEAVVPRIKLYYIKEISVKIEKGKSAQRAKDLLFDYLTEFTNLPAYKSLQWYVMVD